MLFAPGSRKIKKGIATALAGALVALSPGIAPYAVAAGTMTLGKQSGMPAGFGAKSNGAPERLDPSMLSAGGGLSTNLLTTNAHNRLPVVRANANTNAAVAAVNMTLPVAARVETGLAVNDGLVLGPDLGHLVEPRSFEDYGKPDADAANSPARLQRSADMNEAVEPAAQVGVGKAPGWGLGRALQTFVRAVRLGTGNAGRRLARFFENSEVSLGTGGLVPGYATANTGRFAGALSMAADPGVRAEAPAVETAPLLTSPGAASQAGSGLKRFALPALAALAVLVMVSPAFATETGSSGVLGFLDPHMFDSLVWLARAGGFVIGALASALVALGLRHASRVRPLTAFAVWILGTGLGGFFAFPFPTDFYVMGVAALLSAALFVGSSMGSGGGGNGTRMSGTGPLMLSALIAVGALLMAPSVVSAADFGMSAILGVSPSNLVAAAAAIVFMVVLRAGLSGKEGPRMGGTGPLIMGLIGAVALVAIMGEAAFAETALRAGSVDPGAGVWAVDAFRWLGFVMVAALSAIFAFYGANEMSWSWPTTLGVFFILPAASAPFIITGWLGLAISLGLPLLAAFIWFVPWAINGGVGELKKTLTSHKPAILSFPDTLEGGSETAIGNFGKMPGVTGVEFRNGRFYVYFGTLHELSIHSHNVADVIEFTDRAVLVVKTVRRYQDEFGVGTVEYGAPGELETLEIQATRDEALEAIEGNFARKPGVVRVETRGDTVYVYYKNPTKLSRHSGEVADLVQFSDQTLIVAKTVERTEERGRRRFPIWIPFALALALVMMIPGGESVAQDSVVVSEGGPEGGQWVIKIKEAAPTISLWSLAPTVAAVIYWIMRKGTIGVRKFQHRRKQKIFRESMLEQVVFVTLMTLGFGTPVVHLMLRVLFPSMAVVDTILYPMGVIAAINVVFFALFGLLWKILGIKTMAQQDQERLDAEASAAAVYSDGSAGNDSGNGAASLTSAASLAGRVLKSRLPSGDPE